MDIMEETEDIASTFKGSRKRRSLSSILKASPSRQALADVDANRKEDNIITQNPGKTERRKTRRSSKRVSFANTHEVKEFLTEKDARTLGILENSADSSAVMQADSGHSLGSTTQTTPSVSTGPGHNITGLDTLLTGPIVQPQVLEEPQIQSDDGVDAVLSKIMQTSRSNQDSSLRGNKDLALDVNEEQTSGPTPDFLKSLTFNHPPGFTENQDDLEEASEGTVFFKQSDDCDDGNMEMTGFYDNTIHQMPGAAQQIKQQAYYENLGLLGPTYSCKMKSCDSSDASSLHSSCTNSSLNVSSMNSGASCGDLPEASQDRNIPQGVSDKTRVFGMEDASANMELTQAHGSRLQSLESCGRKALMDKPLSGFTDNEPTRLFGQEDHTGMMEMTGCIDNKQTYPQTTKTQQPLGMPGTIGNTWCNETRVYGQGDLMAGMEFTEPVPTMPRNSDTEDKTRIFPKDDQSGAMDMTSVCTISKTGIHLDGKNDEDKTVVFDNGCVTENIDLTECLQVYPVKQENLCPSQRDNGPVGHPKVKGVTEIASSDQTKLYQQEDGGMEMTECVNAPTLGDGQAKIAPAQTEQSFPAEPDGTKTPFWDQAAGIKQAESPYSTHAKCAILHQSLQGEEIKQTKLDSSRETHGKQDKENVPVLMSEPTMNLGDVSFPSVPDGPLDSTHIFHNEHLGRRSAFFPSSALKQPHVEQFDLTMNDSVLIHASSCLESTRKVMERSSALMASTSSNEKTKKALQAIRSRDARMNRSRQSKAKVGLFKGKSEDSRSFVSSKQDSSKVNYEEIPKTTNKIKPSQECPKTSKTISPLKKGRPSEVSEDLPSMLLNTTSSMRYSSVTLNDDLLNSTSDVPSTNKPFPVLSEVKGRIETTATYSIKQENMSANGMTATDPMLCPSARPTGHFSADDDDGGEDMEFTSCVNKKIESNADKENQFPICMTSSAAHGNISKDRPPLPNVPINQLIEENQTKRFRPGDKGGMDLTCVLTVTKETDRFVSDSVNGRKVSQETVMVEDQTRQFGSDDTGKMEFTSCVPTLSKETDRVVFASVTGRPASQEAAMVEDQTRRFGSDDTGKMEFTSCVPAHTEEAVRLVSDSVTGRQVSQEVVMVEDQTRQFGSDDTGKMEFTSCVPTLSKVTERVVSDSVTGRPVSQEIVMVEDQTRRFGSDDTGKMEFTSCVPTRSEEAVRLVSDSVTGRQVSQEVVMVEDQTRRFGSDDTGKMEFTSCVPTLSKVTERVVSDSVTGRPVSQEIVMVEDQTRRFGSDDTGKMEFTSCFPTRSEEAVRLVSDSVTGRQVSQEVVMVEDQTRRFGSDDTGKMEFTSCVSTLSKVTDRVVSASVTVRPASQDAAMVEDQTRRFGSDDTGKMELTACVPRIGIDGNYASSVDRDESCLPLKVDVPESQTRYSVAANKGGLGSTSGLLGNVKSRTSSSDEVTRKFEEEAGKMEFTACVTASSVKELIPAVETDVTSKVEEKTCLYQEGMTEMMELTNVHFKTQMMQDHQSEGSPPCKKSKLALTEGTAGSSEVDGKLETTNQLTDGISNEFNRNPQENDLPVSGNDMVKQSTEGGDPSDDGGKKRNSDTFTLEKSTVAVQDIDDREDGIRETMSECSKVEERETKTNSCVDPGVLGSTMSILDGSFDGIMEEEFQSPDCTEDLEGFILGKQHRSPSRDFLSSSLVPPATSSVLPASPPSKEAASSNAGSTDIPDTFTLGDLCDLFQNSDDDLADAKFGRETLLPVDLKEPKELEDFLQILLITKPDKEIHEWAMTQMQTIQNKIQGSLQPQKQQLVKEKYPEIFQRLQQSFAVGQKIPIELSQLRKYCVKFSRHKFHEWNLKMKTSLEEDLKYGIEKLTPKVDKISEGVTEIDGKIKELDDMISNLDSAIGNMQKVRLPTEGEMEEYLNNKKKLADWDVESHEHQTKIANLQKERDALMASLDQMAKEERHLIERQQELKTAEGEKELSARKQIISMTEKLETLLSLQEWKLEGCSESGNKLHFTFLNRSLDLELEYETEGNQPTKLRQLFLRSYLPDTACPIAKLIHRLILRTTVSDDLRKNYGNHHQLPMLLQSVTRTVINARKLESEIRNVAFWHLMDIGDHSLVVQYSSVKAHARFQVTFDLLPSNLQLGGITTTVAHGIGKQMVEDVEKILAAIKPGPKQLTRTVECLAHLLETSAV